MHYSSVRLAPDTPMSDSPAVIDDPVQWLRDRFRSHLDTFYATLKLAPPYHSVEKAILELTKTLHTLSLDERRRVAQDPAAQWGHFKRAFRTSGLSQKHRGILAGIARRRDTVALPSEYHCLLDAVQEEVDH